MIEIIKIYTDTCTSCKAVEPVLTQASNEIESIQIDRVNATPGKMSNSTKQMIAKYGIRSVPTCIIKMSGKEEKLTGPFTLTLLKDTLKKLGYEK